MLDLFCGVTQGHGIKVRRSSLSRRGINPIKNAGASFALIKSLVIALLWRESVYSCAFYLAQKLCFWTGIIFIGVYVSVCVSVCLCVCLWVFISIISKSYWPILMKLGRMMYNDKRQLIPFENEMNRTGRMQTSPIFCLKVCPFITREIVDRFRCGFFHWIA